MVEPQNNPEIAPAGMPAIPVPTWRDRLSYELSDHAILRHLWTNEHEIAPGVWRSNQPGRRRLRRIRDRGITTILNLRGPSSQPHYRLEQAACAALGLTMIDRRLHARKAASRDEYLDLIDTFARLPRPFLMHCKSGADRAGMASVLYLMTQEGADLATARSQLGLRYLHIPQSRTGILDHTLDLYADHVDRQGPLPIRDWLARHYDADEAMQSFAAKRGRT